MARRRKAVRTQFTFYESFYKSIQELSLEQRGKLLSLICEYALYGVEPPELEGIDGMYVALIMPTLRTARRKAEAGKKGAQVTNALRWGEPQTGVAVEPDSTYDRLFGNG